MVAGDMASKIGEDSNLCEVNSQLGFFVFYLWGLREEETVCQVKIIWDHSVVKKEQIWNDIIVKSMVKVLVYIVLGTVLGIGEEILSVKESTLEIDGERVKR